MKDLNPAPYPSEDSGRPQAYSIAIPIAIPITLAVGFILILTVFAVYYSVAEKLNTETVRLQAIANLKAEQLENWLEERKRDAALIKGSYTMADLYEAWQAKGDEVSRERLLARLKQFSEKGNFKSVLLLNDAGHVLWQSDGELVEVPSPWCQSMLQALRTNEPLRVGPFLDGAGHIHLDFVAPLSGLEQRPKALVVLHAGDEEYLSGNLRKWPVETKSGEVVLFRRSGDSVEFLLNLKHRPANDMLYRRAISEPELLASKLARAGNTQDHVLEGVDYRGVQVFGVGRKIAGTDWYLLAKLDKDELYLLASEDALLIVPMGILAMVLAAGGIYQIRQRRRLKVSRQVQAAQSERLRALRLLASIADSSNDLIFAKDLAGRYLLFNRAAERAIGRPADAVLGLDDRGLFPPQQAAVVMANDQRVMTENRVLTLEEALDTVDGTASFVATKGPLHDEDGQVIGMFGISRDNTANKQAQEALRQSEENYHSLFDEAPVMIHVVDQTGRIVDANLAEQATLGYNREELTGMSLADLVVPELLPLTQAAFRRVMQGETVLAYETVLMTKDGRTIDVEVSATPRVVDGQVVSARAIMRDITARKQTEAALRQQAEDLQRHNDELERFNRASVGRELDMIALKRQVNGMSVRLGERPPYNLGFVEQIQGESPRHD